jgi:hypothetical protein
MPKNYLVEIRVRDCKTDKFIVDFCQYRDTKLECALDMIEARGKIEMSHMFDLLAEGMAKAVRDKK